MCKNDFKIYFTKEHNNHKKICNELFLLRINETTNVPANFAWSENSSDILTELEPNTLYQVAIVGYGCKNTEQTESVPMKTDMFEWGSISLGDTEAVPIEKIGKTLFN